MISPEEIAKACRLAPFEECVGLLKELSEQDGVLVALLGKIHLALPLDMEEKLRPVVGQRIAILRTDLAQKEYLFRVLTEEPEHVKDDGPGG
jgi:hypothetical protein